MSGLLPRYCALIGVLMAAGCAGIRLTGPFRAGPDDWVMYGGSMQRNNASASIIKPPLRELWEYNALGGISGTPVVRDSIVLIGTLHGELQAISLLNGKRLGYVVFESAIKGSPVLDGTNVIVAVSNGSETLVSYSLRSGTRVWSRPYGAIESAPLLSGDLLYVTTLDGYLNCIKKNDGTEVWKYAPEDNRKPIRSSPASDGQTVFFGGDNGVLAAVGGDGQLKWRVQTGASIFATPIVTGEVVVVGNLNGNCYGVRKSDGTLLWNVGLGAPMYGAAAASNGRVFVAAADGVVRALDEFTGQEHWAFSTGSVVNSAPLIAGTMLFIGSLDKTLYVIDVEQGREIWKLEVPGRLKVSPVLWKNTLLLAVEDKYIIALEPE